MSNFFSPRNLLQLPAKIHFHTIAKWTARQRVLPDFIIIGAQKGGTSSLFKYLEGHPELGLSYRKQVHFFDKLYHRGENYYRSCFPLRAFNRGKKSGEATPYYIFHPKAAGRIHRMLPNVKLIATLRNPADRAYSHYNMKVNQGWESVPTFEEAIAMEEERLREEWAKTETNDRYYSKKLRDFSYLARGRYAEQLQRYYALFPKENILVLPSELLFEKPQEALGRIYSFLGISEYQPKNLKVYNKRHYEAMLPETREKLTEYYKPLNEELFRLIGERFDWRNDG